MAARTLDKMRKAQSLIRECHSWLVENNELLLAVELCNIEGSLALLFENRCFANSPCPGLREEWLPRLPPFDSQRRETHRQPYNGSRRPHQINKGRTEAPANRTSGRQNSLAQATTAGRAGDIVSKSACIDVNLKTRARAAVTGAPSPIGVLLDFDHDVELVRLPLNMIVDMEAVNATNVGSEEKKPSPEGRAAEGSDEPAPRNLVRVDSDNGFLHQTISTVADVDSSVGSYSPPPAVEGVAPVPIPSQPLLPGSPACKCRDELPCASHTYRWEHETTESQNCDSNEKSPVLTSTRGLTKDVLVDLDDNLTIILPGGADADTNSTTNLEEHDVLAGDLDPRAGHNFQTEFLRDDEMVFQGHAAKSIRPDFKALFVSSDDESQYPRRAIDLKAIFEKYSEVIICK